MKRGGAGAWTWAASMVRFWNEKMMWLQVWLLLRPLSFDLYIENSNIDAMVCLYCVVYIRVSWFLMKILFWGPVTLQ
jgi:hypothetical protein